MSSPAIRYVRLGRSVWIRASESGLSWISKGPFHFRLDSGGGQRDPIDDDTVLLFSSR